MHDASYSPLYKLRLPAVIRDQLYLAEAGAYWKSDALYYFCVHVSQQGTSNIFPGSWLPLNPCLNVMCKATLLSCCHYAGQPFNICASAFTLETYFAARNLQIPSKTSISKHKYTLQGTQQIATVKVALPYPKGCKKPARPFFYFHYFWLFILLLLLGSSRVLFPQQR